MADSPKIIVVHESWTESAKRDVFTVLCAFVLIGPGVFLDSSAMEWFGFIMASITVIFKAAGLRNRMMVSPDEAIAQIQAIKDAK